MTEPLDFGAARERLRPSPPRPEDDPRFHAAVDRVAADARLGLLLKIQQHVATLQGLAQRIVDGVVEVNRDGARVLVTGADEKERAALAAIGKTNPREGKGT